MALGLAATVPLNAALHRHEFESSPFGRAAVSAQRVAAGRPLVALLGSSQTETGIDARAIEERLAGPVVANVSTGGLHASVYPHLLRFLADRAALDLVVLELGHIAHDQYGGAMLVRNFFDDAPVRDALRRTERGGKVIAVWESEHRLPWTSTPRLLRVTFDQMWRKEDGAIEERMASARGFSPYTTRKDFDEVVRKLEHDPAHDAPDLVDASPQQVFVEVARICRAECESRGIPMVVLLQPVNRPVAARIKVVRHFEATARAETLPALRDLGIEVLVPPERFYDPDRYYDHVHFHREGAAEFTEWLGGELERVRAARR